MRAALIRLDGCVRGRVCSIMAGQAPLRLLSLGGKAALHGALHQPNGTSPRPSPANGASAGPILLSAMLVVRLDTFAGGRRRQRRGQERGQGGFRRQFLLCVAQAEQQGRQPTVPPAADSVRVGGVHELESDLDELISGNAPRRLSEAE